MNKLLEKLKNGKTLPFLLFLSVLGVLVFSLPVQPNTGMTAEEKRISSTLSGIAGAGKTVISIHYAPAAYGKESSAPLGAVVVSQGAGNMAVRLRLMEAAQTLLGLESGQVAVYPMEERP